MDSLKDYYLKKIPEATILVYALVGAVAVEATMLTWLSERLVRKRLHS